MSSILMLLTQGTKYYILKKNTGNLAHWKWDNNSDARFPVLLLSREMRACTIATPLYNIFLCKKKQATLDHTLLLRKYKAKLVNQAIDFVAEPVVPFSN